MNLPVYDNVAKQLEKRNLQKKTLLETHETEKAKKRRVELKNLRVKEGQQRKLWSKQHGQDTYGETEAPDSGKKIKAPQHKSSQVWIRNSLFILQESDRQTIASLSGWLSC